MTENLLLFDRELREARAYWRDHLGSASPALPLEGWEPGDGDRDRLEVAAPQTLGESLGRLTGGSPFLVYTALMAGLVACLERQQRQSHVWVGSPPRRGESGGSDLSGALPVVVAVRRQGSFRELLLSARQTLLDSYGYQAYPYRRLLADLELDGERSPPPFDVSLRLEGLHGDLVETRHGLLLEVVAELPTLTLEARFSAARFGREEVRRLIERWWRGLEWALHDVEHPVGRICWLGSEEQERLLSGWAHGQAAEWAPSAVEEISRRVSEQPEAIALIEEQQLWTYGAVERAALALGRRLLSECPTRRDEEPVMAVLAAPGLVWAAAQWGARAAGFAFLAIDPEQPEERISFQLRHGSARVVVTPAGAEARIPAGPWRSIGLEPPTGAKPETPMGSPTPEPEALAYILYTSGSAGEPKGVAVEQGGLDQLVAWHRTTYQIGPGKRLSQLASPSFDASIWELWPALAAGATLVIVPPLARLAVDELAGWLEARAIDQAFVPTGLAEPLLTAARGGPRGLLLTGGDRLRVRPGEGIRFGVVNHYGPTETTVVATAAPVLAFGGDGRLPTIGRPIRGFSAYVLDPALELVPAGAAGELFLAGVGLARGYLRAASATAEGFRPHPFAVAPGSRLYATGDRVRFRADGELEFLGRVDDQVKIRGQRIEPGEVEAALAALEGVREALVVPFTDAAGDLRLAVYLVMAPPAEPSWPTLREQLAGRLPEVMLPRHVTFLDRFPTTSRGKIDRRALPPPKVVDVEAGVAPRNAVEARLAAIWSEVLELPAVGVLDRFFALGGDSIKAIQVVARANEQGLELSARELFLHPTVAELANLVSLRDGVADAEPTTAIPSRRDWLSELSEQNPWLSANLPADAEDVYPLSPLQHGMLFHSLLEPGTAMYLVQEVFAFDRDLEPAALRQAWRWVVARHAVLRTSFLWEQVDRPMQVLHRAAEPPWRELDGSHFELAAGAADWRDFLVAERAADFDLAHPPLLRLTLVRLGAGRFRLVFTYHHLLLDGWSLPLLLAEVVTAYRAVLDGVAPSLSPAVPFGRYIDWLALQGQGPAEAFWRDELSGLNAPTPLAVGKPRRHGEVEGTRLLPFGLGEAGAGALRAAARAHGLTVATLIQGAWAMLLSRYSGELDVLFGATVSGRPPDLPGVESILGPFLNTLPVRSRLKPVGSLGTWLAEHQRRQAEARQHSHGLLVEIQGWSSIPRGTALFDTLLVFENTPVDAFWRREVREESRRLELTTAESFGRLNYPLTVCLEDDGQDLAGTLYFERSSFEPETLERLSGHLRQLLLALGQGLDRPIAAFSLLSASERRQLLERWNDDPTFRADEGLIHRRFEAQADLSPDAVAVVFGDVRLSYGELEARSNRLAWELIDAGAGPEERLAVYLERSEGMVVALLAVLKAGAAYVPLDPLYPEERVAFMATDARTSMLLVGETSAPPAFATAGRVLHLGAAAEVIRARPSTRPRVEVDAAGLAYVLYTSGSTGRPKGVALTHGGAAALMEWVRRNDLPEDLAGVLASTSICFDCTIFELFGTLGAGGKVIVGQNVFELPRLPAFAEVTLVSALPSILLDFLGRGELPASLRLVHLGGESSPADLVPRLLRHTATRRVLHVYGPTEDTTYATTALITEVSSGPMPIGRSILGKAALVVDRWGDLAPIGVAGEVRLAGVGLARGYLDRPAQTAERFVPDAFGLSTGGRLYRTGDLARRLPDGALEFLGRIDHQVKIRGLRVELGEIEAALEEIAGIEQAVVVLRGSTERGPTLVAFYLATRDFEDDELRSRLALRLPEAMIPARSFRLAELPRLPNKKVDRAALPFPELEEVASPRRAPTGVTETKVAAVWAEVLRLDAVTAEDGFFELGGHSLLATQVVARLRQAFGVELPLRALFEAPTVELLSRRLDELSVSAPRGDQDDELPIADRGSDLPLTFAQERLWFLHQMAPQVASYNCPLALRLYEPLPGDLLGRILLRLATRQESLRSRFPARDGVPVVRVDRPTRPALAVVDLGAIPLEPARRVAQALAECEARRPFDLERGPMLRARLLRLEARESWVVLGIHHIVSDGWSMGLLTQELAELWRIEKEGCENTLAPLPRQVVDFAVWQKSAAGSARFATDFAYWRQRLAALPEEAGLPTDRPRTGALSQRAAELTFALQVGPSARLQALARDRQLSLFMVVLAAFATLVARFRGSEDVVLGTPLAQRPRPELEGAVGFFVNTLALRLRLQPARRFDQVLGLAREAVLEAFAHQNLPFERLVEELKAGRDLSRHPIFQLSLTLQQSATPGAAPTTEGPFETLALPATAAHFDLTLACAWLDERLVGTVQYSADLFDGATIERLVAAFGLLLEGVSEAPDANWRAIPLLSAEVRAELVDRGQGPRAELPESCHLAGLFAASAAHHPEAVAVAGEENFLSYAGLASRAAALARELERAGCMPAEPVALLSRDPAELALGALATVTAGGAYLPLDPRAPEERWQTVLAEVGVRFVLGLAPELEEDGRRVWSLAGADQASTDQGSDAGATASREWPDGLPAYLITTSGSTGRPKAVRVSHRAVARLVLGADYLDLTRPRRIASLSSPAFDAATFELWGALLHGSTLVAIADFDRLDPHRLALALERTRINTAFLTTALFHLLARERPGAFAGLDDLLFGGEAVEIAPVRGLLAAAPPRRLLHVYGPTEATTFATWHEVRELPAEAGTVPIGRALANTWVGLLDRYGEPVPAGAVGEIVLGGPGLALDYLHKPAATAERFVPAAAGLGPPGSRLYHTGDLGRFDPQGALVFLGRADRQVKIRGFRVEPAEVEQALRDLAGVASSAVLVAESEPLGRHLLAFVVAEPGAVLSAQDGLKKLRRQLPEAMVPARLMVLAALPLTSTGKLDRPRLLELAAATDEAPARPSSVDAVGELVEQAYLEVLGLSELPAEGDFFTWGGHSLLATRLAARLRERLETEVPLPLIFEQPTPSELAAAIRLRAQAERGLSSPPILPLPSGTDWPLSPAQQRLWFLHRLSPSSPVYNIPSPLRLRGQLTAAALVAAVASIVARHAPLRSRLALVEGELRQLVEAPSSFRLRHLDLSALPVEVARQAASRWVETDAVAPFDLGSEVAFRCLLVQVAVDELVLAPNFHHSVADGWSVRLFFAELSELMAAQAEGRSARLPALRVAYGDFAFWQRRWLEPGGELAPLVSYWREELTGLPPVLDLPADRPRPAVQSFRGVAVARWLEPAVWQALAGLAREQRVTLFTVVLAGFQVLLSRLSASPEVPVATTVAGRDRLELEPLIGLFVNTLVLRGRLGDDPSLAQFLRRTRRVVLDAFHHQGAPFERVVEELDPVRDLSFNPLAQVLLVFLAEELAPAAALAPTELDAELLPCSTGSAKFDLSLFVAEQGEGALLSLELATDLFDPATGERLLEGLAALLTGLPAGLDRRVSQLSLLRPAEQLELLAAAGSRAEAREELLHEAFERQVEETPEAVALRFEDEEWLYRELAARALGVARRLARRGIGPDDRVGLCLERTPDLLVGLLGILKAGAAYLPFDPEEPPERLRAVAQSCGCRFLLTQPTLEKRLAELGFAVLSVESEETGGDEPLRPEPSNLAYVLTTSGSTGSPKAVAVEHRSAAALVRWGLATYGPDDTAVTLAGTSVCFDISVFELFVPWSRGGVVQLAAHALAVPRLASGRGITLLNTVPSVMAELVAGRQLPPSVRVVNLAGEALARELVDRVWTAGQVERVFNLYGPTEATVYATALEVPRRGEAPTLGRPIAGVFAHVVARGGALQPLAVPGELWLGGVGLARGYLAAPAATASRFVPDPFDSPPGSRLYRTGDRVRRRVDGELEFLGRLDRQVKVRGFRIELEEVERALLAHPAVVEAAVVVSEQGTQLVAHYQLAGPWSPSTRELREELEHSLPRALVPGLWVKRDTWPRTSGGKLDRRQLAVAESAGSSPRSKIAPRDPLEAMLARIWEELLCVDRVGATDHFFELGGHSLLAERVVVEVERRLGLTLPLAALFAHPTVEDLAAAVRRMGSGRPTGSLLPLGGQGEGPPIVFVHGAGGSVFPYQALARRLSTESPMFGLEQPAQPGAATVAPSLPALAELYRQELDRHAGDRHFGDRPLILIGWSFGGLLAYELAGQLDRAGRAVALLVLIDTWAPRWSPRGQAEVDPIAASTLARSFGFDLGIDRDRLEPSTIPTSPDPEEWLSFLHAEAIRQERLPPDYPLSVLEERYSLFARNLRAAQSYQPASSPVPTLLLRASEAVYLEGEARPGLGWRELVGAALVEAEVTGHHYQLLAEPHVEAVAAKIVEQLVSLVSPRRGVEILATVDREGETR